MHDPYETKAWAHAGGLLLEIVNLVVINDGLSIQRQKNLWGQIITTNELHNHKKLKSYVFLNVKTMRNANMGMNVAGTFMNKMLKKIVIKPCTMNYLNSMPYGLFHKPNLTGGQICPPLLYWNCFFNFFFNRSLVLDVNCQNPKAQPSTLIIVALRYFSFPFWQKS